MTIIVPSFDMQGPPGTGKTYVAEILLELFLTLTTLPKAKPIIIMTYRNKALDYLLEKCLRFCPTKGMMRIGHLSEGYNKKLGETLLTRRIHNALCEYNKSIEETFQR